MSVALHWGEGMSKFSVDTHLFRELGRLLVGRDSTALVELIKNSYDADATEVTVHGENFDNPKQATIIVSDNGNGMTVSLFEEGFLKIASRTKELGNRRSLRFGRRFTGAKGIGRLAAHKLAEVLTVLSVPHPLLQSQEDKLGVAATIDWGAVERLETLDQVDDNAVKVEGLGLAGGAHGTKITLSRLRKKWTSSLRASFLHEIEGFLVPDALVVDPRKFVVDAPLFASPRVRDADFDQGFKVIRTGDLDVGDQHVHNVASTADWLIEIKAELSSPTVEIVIQPTSRFEKEYSSAKKRMFRVPRPPAAPAFEARIYSRWGKGWDSPGVRVYQEGFRVLPYGDSRDDWLGLDAFYKQRERRLRFLEKIEGAEFGDGEVDEGLSSLGNSGFFGAVFLTVDGAPTLEMLVNREGFIPSDAFEDLKSLVQAAIQLNIRERAKVTAPERMARSDSRIASALQKATDGKKLSSSELAREQLQLAETAVDEALRVVQGQQIPTAESLESIRSAVQVIRDAQRSVFSEAQATRLLAALGLQLAAFVHEIRGLMVQVRQIEELSTALREESNASPSGARASIVRLSARIGDLRRAMERQVAYLEDVTSADARRRRSRQPLAESFDTAANLYLPEAARKSVEIRNEIPKDLKTPQPLFASELIMVFTNLVSNAVKFANEGGRILARAELDSHGAPAVLVMNTGERVALDDAERWFLPFESNTSTVDPFLGKGMGMGLTITRELLEDYGIGVAFVVPDDGYATALRVNFGGRIE
jgi:signal transduction histidine kinase